MLTVQVLASTNPDFYPMRFSLCGTSVRSVHVVHIHTHTHTRAEVCSCVHILNHTTHTHQSLEDLQVQSVSEIRISWGGGWTRRAGR